MPKAKSVTPQNIAVKFYGKPTRTNEGFLDVPVVIAKKMVMSYDYDGKVVNELLDLPYNDKDFVNSCNGLPFVLDHPTNESGEPVDFNTENYQKEAKGIILDPVSVPEEEAIYGKLRIWDNGIAEMVENDEIKEVSQGYRSADRKESGTYNGEHYDIVQTPQPFNHLALVNEGRGGQDVRILYNSKQSKGTMKVNSQVASELYEKFKQGEIIRMAIKSKANAAEEPKKPEGEEKPKENDETLPPAEDADKDTQILSALQGMSKIMMAIAQKMGIGGENQNADEKPEPEGEEKEKMKDEIMNKTNAKFAEFENKMNVLQMQSYVDREEAVTMGGIITSEAPSLMLKCNGNVDEFKRKLLVMAGESENEVKKMNSIELKYSFKHMTGALKRNINAPAYQDESFESQEANPTGTF